MGKSIYLMQLLKSIADKDGKTVLYIPNQNFGLNDYLQILQTEKYGQIVKNQHIIGLDNFPLTNELQDIFRNSKLFIVPKELSNPYSSEIITPFNETESIQFINEKSEIELDPVIVRTIVSYSAGIPKLIDTLLSYFTFNKKLSIENLLVDNEVLKVLDSLYDDFLSQINADSYKLLVGLVAVGKPLSFFSKSIKNDIITTNFTLFKRLEMDGILRSPLLLTFFNNKIGKAAILDFKKNGIKELLSGIYKDALGIWTANNEFRFFNKNSTIEDVAKEIFKTETLIHRIDWEKSLINNKQIDTRKTPASFGDEIHFILGKRNEEMSRNSSYKENNKKYKKLIWQGDVASKKGNFTAAESFYLATENITYNNSKFVPDANYAKVRLANLFRIQGKLQEASDICLKITRSTPNPFAHLCLGICKFWEGELGIALEHFDKSINFKDNYINAVLWKVRVLIHLKQLDKAEGLLLKIKSQELTDDVKFIYLVLNYFVCFHREYSPKDKKEAWRKKIFYFLSDHAKYLPERQGSLIALFLIQFPNKEPEFADIQERYNNCEILKGIQTDLYWWKILMRP